MALMKALLTCEDSYSAAVVGHISAVDEVPFIVVVLGFDGRSSLIGAIQLFCFLPVMSRERRTSLNVSPVQTVWDGGHAVLL